ncbi:hypothetical protein CLF_108452 [Clonorchis sinensis]|uniref:Uncharacterized protein n=1 Tax=Clonorchis sinensis TaxID=79923 RepID=G7YI30_CLOSI|nr:hypothetical protein CLF_108452 [Clonorchis sinensis]
MRANVPRADPSQGLLLFSLRASSDVAPMSSFSECVTRIEEFFPYDDHSFRTVPRTSLAPISTTPRETPSPSTPPSPRGGRARGVCLTSSHSTIGYQATQDSLNICSETSHGTSLLRRSPRKRNRTAEECNNSVETLDLTPSFTSNHNPIIRLQHSTSALERSLRKSNEAAVTVAVCESSLETQDSSASPASNFNPTTCSQPPSSSELCSTHPKSSIGSPCARSSHLLTCLPSDNAEEATSILVRSLVSEVFCSTERSSNSRSSPAIPFSLIRRIPSFLNCARKIHAVSCIQPASPTFQNLLERMLSQSVHSGT